MSLLADVMRSLVDRLKADLVATRTIAHHLSKGSVREAAIRSSLARHLPSRYSLGKGLVINPAGDSSREQDILIVDNLIAGPFAGEGEVQVFPIEAVSGAIEVKSRLSPSTVEDAVASVASVKRLLPPDHEPRVRQEHQRVGNQFDDLFLSPYGGVIAYSIDGQMAKVAEAFYRANEALPLRERANALVVLEEPSICFWGVELEGELKAKFGATKVWFSTPSEHALGLWAYDSDDVFAVFFWTIWDVLNRYHPPDLEPFLYLQSAELGYTSRFWKADGSGDEIT